VYTAPSDAGRLVHVDEPRAYSLVFSVAALDPVPLPQTRQAPDHDRANEQRHVDPTQQLGERSMNPCIAPAPPVP